MHIMRAAAAAAEYLHALCPLARSQTSALHTTTWVPIPLLFSPNLLLLLIFLAAPLQILHVLTPLTAPHVNAAAIPPSPLPSKATPAVW
eukprot:1156446-Pelagomonas_calceolata.AAC.18